MRLEAWRGERTVFLLGPNRGVRGEPALAPGPVNIIITFSEYYYYF